MISNLNQLSFQAYGTIEFETNRILDNLKVILEQYGSDMDHVVRIDVLLASWADKNAMNAEYVKHFKREKLPARVCYGDVAIAGDCKVEMVVIATKRKRKSPNPRVRTFLFFCIYWSIFQTK